MCAHKMNLSIFSRKTKTSERVASSLVSNIDQLLSDLGGSKDGDIENKVSKKDLLSLLLNVAAVVARSVDVHYGTRDNLNQLTQTLRWVFYLALVALFKNELIQIISIIFRSITSYILNGFTLYKAVTPDQKFNFWYILPLSALFALGMYLLGRNSNKKK
jgi:hypothetical protein